MHRFIIMAKCTEYKAKGWHNCIKVANVILPLYAIQDSLNNVKVETLERMCASVRVYVLNK